MNCAPRYLLLISFQMNCFYLYHDNIKVREYINHVSVMGSVEYQFDCHAITVTTSGINIQRMDLLAMKNHLMGNLLIYGL